MVNINLLDDSWPQKAQSELAYDLQASITKQKIKEEEMQIRVVERAQQISVQEQVQLVWP